MSNEPVEEKIYMRYELTGIGERNKNAPAWFVVLFILLLIWGAYYLITNWGGLGPGIGY